MYIRLLSFCALVALAACGGSGGGGNAQINGQTVSQAAVNCEDALAGSPSGVSIADVVGVTFENAAIFPSIAQIQQQQRAVLESIAPQQFDELGDNVDFIGGGSPPQAIFSSVSGNAQFYGFPIEAALNTAWIVTGNVDEVAAAVLRARNLDVSIDQLRTSDRPQSASFGEPQGFVPDMFYGEESETFSPYQPEYGNQASNGLYDFTQATRAYQFPELTAERTGFIHELKLWRLSPTLTLASCYSRDPTIG